VTTEEKTMASNDAWLNGGAQSITHIFEAGPYVRSLLPGCLDFDDRTLPRSTHNVRIERVWRDVRKDTLEVFRQVFQRLEEEGDLDMQNIRHRACLYLVYQPRIQASLDGTREAWNNHKVRTAGNRTPVALFELSRTRAINGGYWNGDPRGHRADAGPAACGVNAEAPLHAFSQEQGDPANTQSREDLYHGSASLHTDLELEVASELLKGLDLTEEDGEWGARRFRQSVHLLDLILDHNGQGESGLRQHGV